MNIEDKLLSLKRHIEEAKAEYNKAQGVLKQLNQQLKDEFDCDDLEEAKTKLDKMQKETEASEELITSKLKKLEEKYNW